MPVELRKAQVSDTARLIACIEAAYADYRDRGIDLPPVSDGVLGDIREHHVWVVEDQGVIAGCVFVKIDGAIATLTNIAVHPEFGKRGVGRKLLDHAVAAAQASGCEEMRLTTHADMPANVSLYEHLGWKVTGRDGDKVYMRRRLSG